MSGVETIIVAGEDDGLRLDRWFRRHYPALSHGRLQKLLRTGQIRLEGTRAKSGAHIQKGNKIRVPPLADDPRPPRPVPKAAPVRADDVAALEAAILHRDDHIIALNKPAGLAVQGGSKVHRHVDAMLDSLRFGAPDRPRLVHRLDKDTSGVLLIGRTASAAAQLTAAFRAHTTEKIYWAAVKGVPRPRHGLIDQPLRKEPVHHGEMVVASTVGQSAVTHYQTIAAAGRRAAWLELRPQTGRTHQLRVHCAAMGTPILGDGKYGGAEAFLKTEAIAPQVHLHARAIRLAHPGGGAFSCIAPLSDHMLATWAFLGFDERDTEAGLFNAEQVS